ncbi:MAG: hypothetical protein V4536_08850 [Pseudomonadota bacterium]
MSAQALDSFFVELFFKGDTTAAKQFDESLTNIHASALKVGAVMVGAAAGLLAFVGGVAHGMGELQDFAETNDMSASKLDALGKVAKATDVDMEQLKSSIAGLNGITGEAALGIGRGAMIFEKLGLSAKDASGNVRGVDEMLEVVADKIKGLPRAEQLAMLGKLRIDPNMVKLLKDGGAALRQMREEAEGKGLFTDADYDRADKLDKLFGRSTVALGQMAKLLAVNLFPAVEKILNGFLDFYNAQRKATSGTFITAFKLMGAALETVWDWVVRLKNGVMFLVDALQKFNILTYLASGVLTVFAGVAIAKAVSATYELIAGMVKQGIAMLSNITIMGLMTSAVRLLKGAINGLLTGAIFLIIDDLVNWYEGNDSVIKQLYDDFPVALALLSSAMAGLMLLMNTFGITSAIAWMIAFWPVTLGILAIAGLGTAIWYFWDNLKSVGEKIYQFWHDYVIDPFQKAVDLFNQVKGFAGGSFSSRVDVNQTSKTQASGINSIGGILGVSANQGSVSSQSNTTVVQGTVVNVKTDNPDVLAKSFDRATREAVRNHQNSVAN